MMPVQANRLEQRRIFQNLQKGADHVHRDSEDISFEHRLER